MAKKKSERVFFLPVTTSNSSDHLLHLLIPVGGAIQHQKEFNSFAKSSMSGNRSNLAWGDGCKMVRVFKCSPFYLAFVFSEVD